MSSHDVAGVIVQTISDTYFYNSPWWVYFIAAFALFGLGVNILIGGSLLLKALGMVVTIKKPGWRADSVERSDESKITKPKKEKKPKEDPLGKLS